MVENSCRWAGSILQLNMTLGSTLNKANLVRWTASCSTINMTRNSCSFYLHYKQKHWESSTTLIRASSCFLLFLFLWKIPHKNLTYPGYRWHEGNWSNEDFLKCQGSLSNKEGVSFPGYCAFGLCKRSKNESYMPIMKLNKTSYQHSSKTQAKPRLKSKITMRKIKAAYPNMKGIQQNPMMRRRSHSLQLRKMKSWSDPKFFLFLRQ